MNRFSLVLIALVLLLSGCDITLPTAPQQRSNPPPPVAPAHEPSRALPPPAPHHGDVWVDPYTDKNGRYVKGHWRSSPK